MLRFEKKTALITGASSGIGKAFAEALAAGGANVILVARSSNKLNLLAAAITKQYRVNAKVIVADLREEKAPGKIYTTVQKFRLPVDMLINNAGFGTHGLFHVQSTEVEYDEIMVNVSALVQLTHLFLPGMLKKKDGIIVNVASNAAFQPVPYMAVYGATKAFVLSFSEALWAEYRKDGIRVLALCPGATDTNFSKVVGTEDSMVGRKRSTDSVVATALKALERGKSCAIDGNLNYLLANLIRLSPRGVTAKMTAQVMKPK